MASLGDVVDAEELPRLLATLGELGFTRASLLTGSDRASRYLVVPEAELEDVGQPAARARVEPLFPGAKAEFLVEKCGMPVWVLF